LRQLTIECRAFLCTARAPSLRRYMDWNF
jgi:hypothetical protein